MSLKRYLSTSPPASAGADTGEPRNPQLADRLANKKPLLERSPFGAVGNSDQSLVDRLFDRAMLRQRNRHVGRGQETLRYLENFAVRLGDVVLQRTDAVDYRVRLPLCQRLERFR